MQLIPATLLLLRASSLCAAFNLPSPTGPYRVGTVSLELIDHERNDTLAPTPQPRDLMISLFYPTRSVENHTLPPAYPPQTAAHINREFGLPAGLFESIISGSYLNASLSNPDVPVVLFSPGFNGVRQTYTALLQEIASLGYIVVAIDHPYDASIIEYPDGRVILRSLSVNITEWPFEPQVLVDIRVADMRFVLDSLEDKAVLAKIPGLDKRKAHLRTRRICSYGHSLGGAASVSLLLVDNRFACGVDMDGALFGPITETASTHKPVLIMGAYGNTRDAVPGWAEAWENFRGFKRHIRFENATHLSFTDFKILSDGLGGAIPPEVLGTIPGIRMLEIEAAYLAAFFGRALDSCGDKCELGLLDGPSPEYPEVIFDD